MRGLPAILMLTAALLCAAPVPAMAESGVARGVDQNATAELGGNVRQLVVGADVSIGETVKTDAKGLVQLLFRDNSKLVVGPNSTLVIEDFLIRDNNTAGRFAINTLSGAFRFVTGSGPKDDYVIKTPTGTIGVRGTGFDWTIITKQISELLPPAPISTVVLLFEGGVRICNLAGQCQELSDICDFGAFNVGGAVVLDNTREARNAFRGYFPITTEQQRLLFPFWLTGSRECLNPPPVTGNTGTPLVSGPNGGIPPATTTTTTTTPPTTTTTIETTTPPVTTTSVYIPPTGSIT